MYEVYDYNAGRLVPDHDWLVNESVNKANRTVNGRALTPAEQLAKHQQQVQRQNYMRMADSGLASQSVPNAVYSVADAQRDRNLEVDGDYTLQLTDFYNEQPKNPAGNTQSTKVTPQESAPVQAVITTPAVAVQKRTGNGDPAVRALQERLNAGGAGLKVDGIYGPKTQQARFEESNKAAPEVIAFKSGDRPAYVPGPIQQETNMSNQVPKEGLAAKANGLDESTAYWLSGDAPEGYIPTARYNSFSDMFK